MNGLILLDKPAGMTSAAAAGKVKWLLPRGTKIGHAGTLDPFATGLLILMAGRATKYCEQLMGLPKTYEATVKLGATTATDDPDSPEQPWPAISPVAPDAIVAALPRFLGSITQRPPVYSAIKIGGRRACDRVRTGQTIELQPRVVQIYGIDVLHYEWPFLRLRIDCGRGTYIRSIGRDLGEALKVGGHLTNLRRTRTGPYLVADAVTMDALSFGILSRLMAVQWPSSNLGQTPLPPIMPPLRETAS